MYTPLACSNLTTLISYRIMTISFQKYFFAIALAVLLIFIFWIAKTLLVPLAFGLVFSLVLYPLVKWIHSKGPNLLWSILFTILSIFLVSSGILFFFSAKLVSIIEEYEDFQLKLTALVENTIAFINESVPFISGVSPESLMNSISSFFADSGLFIVSDTISTTGTTLSYILLATLYTFLILLYHKNFTIAATKFVPEDKREKFMIMLRSVQKVGQQYLTGMALLILILGVLNSIGLLIIGLDYAIFFGFFAAVLAIIPYVGTTLGGFVPALYALMTMDSYWYAVAVVLTFWFIQTIEGNILSPKIVGGNLNLNPLAAVLALISGGLLWGLPGMILALPTIAILNVIFDHYDELKPVALLLEDKHTEEKDGFFKRMVKKVSETKL